MAIGWRPYDIDSIFLPFMHSVGIQVALSDPKFMEAQGLKPFTDDDVPQFPYDPAAADAALARGDPIAVQRARCAAAWMGQSVNGKFRTWEDVRFLRANWDGPLIVKGILSAQVGSSRRESAMAALRPGLSEVLRRAC